jgi:hypothetical protein
MAQFVVMGDIRQTQIGQIDKDGVYQVCMIMHYPFDRNDAAKMVCDALNELHVTLAEERVNVPPFDTKK